MKNICSLFTYLSKAENHMGLVREGENPTELRNRFKINLS
jgi:hypothetical protein